LPAIIRIFGEKEIQSNLQELNTKIFV